MYMGEVICLKRIMMIKNRKWKEFFLGDEEIFTLHATLNGINKNKLVDDGEAKFPYVTRTKINNGLDMFISKQPSPINKGNVIIIGLDTQTVFYQETDFYTGQNVQILYNCYLTKNIALFLIPIIKKQLEVLNWGGNGATLGRLKKKRVKLPIKNDGTPDWIFMEEYVQTKTKQIKSSYQSPKKHEISDFRCLDDVEWGEFKLETIANIKGGKDWEQYNRITGQVPFIGASAQNNGVTDFVSPKGREAQVGKGVLGINRNGSVGYVFYHPYQAYFSGDTRFLEINGFKGKKFINQFIQTMILAQKDKYAYGYKMGTQRIKNQIIKLPILKDGEPDFEFMEQYMKRLETKVVKQGMEN